MKDMEAFGETFEYWKRQVKPLRDLDKHTVPELVGWVDSALDEDYPHSRKSAFAKLSGANWKDIRRDIMETVESQNYAKIHRLNNILNIDLLNMEVARKIGAVVNGTLAVIKDRDSPGRSAAKLALLQTFNEELKNAKLETYLLYRRLGGKPRLSFGFLSKV